MSEIELLVLGRSIPTDTKDSLREADIVIREQLADRSQLEKWEQKTVDVVLAILSDQELRPFITDIREWVPDTPLMLVGQVEDSLPCEFLELGVLDYIRWADLQDHGELVAHRIRSLHATAQEDDENAIDGIQDQLERAANTLTTTAETTTATDTELEEKLNRLISTGAEKLGFPIGYITRIESETQEILAATGDHEAIQPGKTDPLGQTYCRKTIEDGEPIVLEDASAEGWTDDPAYERFNLRCYIGSRIVVDGEVYGTVCFADEHPRKGLVEDVHQSTVKALAQWIGYEIERHQHETELEEREERLRVLFDHAPDGIVIHDEQGDVFDVNNTLTENLGYGREELLSMNVVDFEVGFNREYLLEAWGKTDSSQPMKVEGTHQRKDGSTYPVEVWVSRIELSGKSRFVAICRDVTERKKQRRQLEEREAKYRNLFEESRDALMVLDQDGFDDCNDAALELFGIENTEAFTGYAPYELSPDTQPDGRSSKEAALDHIDQAFETGEEFFEWTHRTASGEPFHAEVKLSRFELNDRPLLHALVRDITDRKQRERELERFEIFVESSSAVVTVLDDTGAFEYQSPAISRVLGYDPDELIGENVFDYIHPEDQQRVTETFSKSIDDPRTERKITYRFRAADGSWRWLHSIGVNHLENPAVEGIVVNSIDVTDRKERERELERYEHLWRHLPVGVCRVDPTGDGTFIEVNDTLLEIAGAESREELLEHSVADLWANENEREEVIEQVMETGRETVERRFETLNGQTVWLRLVVMAREESPYVDVVIQDITDRRQREIHLEKAQEAGDIGWWRKDIPSDQIYWSEQVYEMWGAEGGVGLIDHEVFMEFIHPDDRGFVEEAWEAAKEGDPYDIEHRIVTGDGETRWMREKAELTFNEDNQAVSAVGIVQDITDRKKRERELERFEEIVESASDVLWMFRDDFSETLFMNSQYETVFGQSMRTLQDDPLAFIEAVHPDDRDLMHRQVERISNGNPVDFELRVNPEEEYDRWVWIKGSPIYDTDGTQYAVSGFVRDITDRKKAQRQLEQFEQAIEQTAHVVYITDPKGTIEYVNPAFEKVTGYTEEEATGNTPTLLQSGEHGEDFYEQLWETILSGDQWQSEVIDKRKDDQRIILDQTISPLTDGDGDIKKFVAVAQDITDRKKRERELERHRAYLESANDMITLIEPDGTIEYVSPAIERVLGWEPGELRGKNGFEYVHPEDRDDRIEDINALAEGNDREMVLEFRFQCADGSYCWIEATARDLLDEPDIEGLLLSSRNVTDRKEHERQIAALHDATRDLIDAESKVDIANIAVEAASDLLDFSLPSMWYPEGDELMLVANSEEHQQLLEEAGTPDPAHPRESWIWDVFEDGETVVRSPISREELAADVPLQSAIVLPIKSHGIFACAAKGDVDFTDRQIRVAEILAQNVRVALDQLDQRAALERQKEFVDDLLDAIEDVVYVLDQSGDLQMWNTALETVTGYKSDEITSMNATEFFAGDDVEAAAEAVEEAFETGRTRVELDFQSKDGDTIPYEFIANVFEDPEGEPVMAGSGRDRTLHVEYEQRLEEQRDRLNLLNQVVRHDVRNDMQIVHGRAQILEDYVDEEGEPHLREVIGATEEAIELTKTARDLTETMLREEEELKPISLSRELSLQIEEIRSQHDSAVVRTDGRLPPVDVQADEMLEAVFRNLLQNAIVHNDKEVPEVTVGVELQNGTVQVQIADNGPGIPDSQKEDVFGKGEKGLDSPGTGLGLYLVKTLVENYGGTVWIEDNDPEGAVFIVELPVAE